MIDRGHKKWVSMMLPEHKDRLQRWVESQTEVEDTELDEDKLEELNQVIQFCLNEDRTAQVCYYSNKRLHYSTGKIVKVDMLEGTISLAGLRGLLRISIRDVKDIDLVVNTEKTTHD
ncbi:hypothetical protein BSK66_27590 [Paenibacillus odorifer]|uniref:YolD-like family protein n=1 Tax=Paenibacillus TaxID=44249 RepID=UPI0003E2C139|nr:MULTISPECIES: YolD-like family protein [Paenibacillus]ETT61313.1 SPBc2 prophage-derived protein YolD [Paenibacillus sp. FSL H8-237]OMD13722.1 hypothetical protein BJP47_24140 [Paenibacillus odorifer]OME48952.1 hypothetical protein BSK66_27590 [Paenibacillus odorifer]